MRKFRFAVIDLARALAVAVVVALAFASSQKTLPRSWGFMAAQLELYGNVSADVRDRTPGYAIGLPVEYFDFYREHLRRGERYYLYVPAAPDALVESLPPGVDLPDAVRLFGRFYLLPAIQVNEPERADIILTFRSDPRDLGIAYDRIEQAGGASYFVAWIAR